MDYRVVRNQKKSVKREKLMAITIVVMVCIIIIQAIIAVILGSMAGRLKKLYEEALSGQVTMQEEINRLNGRHTPNDVSAYYGITGDAENTAGDIPFVTEGKEIENESGINN